MFSNDFPLCRNNSVNQKSAGFALVEILLAALVLAIGSAAFLKLQNISLKNSSNNFARSQANAITTSFIEQLRGNHGFVQLSSEFKTGAILAGILPSTVAPQNNSNCQSANPSLNCAQATLNYQRYLTSEKMQYAFQKTMSLLCYRTNASGYLRLTFIWHDNLNNKNVRSQLAANDCPNSFSSHVDSKNRHNSVTVYAQL